MIKKKKIGIFEYLFILYSIIFLLAQETITDLSVSDLYFIGIFNSLFTVYLVNKNFHLTDITNPFIFLFIYDFIFNFSLFLIKGSTEFYQYQTELIFINNIFLLFTAVGALLYIPGLRDFQDVNEKLKINSDRIEGLLNRKFVTDRVNILFIIGIVFLLVHFFFIAKGIPMLADDRENFRVSSKIGQGQILAIGTNIVFVTAIVYGSILIFKKKYIYIFHLTIASLFLLSIGYRAIFLKVIVALLILTIIHKNKIPSTLTFISSIVLGLIMLAILGLYRLGPDGISALISAFENGNSILMFNWTLGRIYSTNYGLDIVLNKINNPDQFLYGMSYYRDIVTLLPGYQESFGYWIKREMNLFFDGGTLMLGPHGIYYVNFGIFGVAILSAINSIILLKVNKFLIFSKISLNIFYLIIITLTFTGIHNILGLIMICFMDLIFIRVILKK